MKNIKKIVMIMFVAIIGFSMTACSNDGGGKKDDYTAHVFFWNYADAFVGELRTNLEREFKDANINYVFHDGGNSQAKQNDQIDTAISTGADILVLNLVEAETGEAVLAKADAANIPSIFFNRQPEHSIFEGKENAVLLDGDVVGGAKEQGRMIAEFLLEDYDKYAGDDGIVDYIMIRAELSHVAATARTKYAVEQANELLVAAGKPELRRHASAPADLLADDWSAAKGKDAMSTIMSTVSDVGSIELVIANNDGIAEGVLSALNEKDYNTGTRDNYIPVFGYDATNSGKDLVKQDKLSGTILQDALTNAKIITTAVANKQAGKDFVADSEYKYDGTFNRIVINDVIYDPAVH